MLRNKNKKNSYKKILYKVHKTTFQFVKFKTMQCFGDAIKIA